MKTRLISFLLLLALVVTAMPLVSFATETEAEDTPVATVSTMTEAEYNALYVQDGLAMAADFFKMNKYWNPLGEGHTDYVVPVAPYQNAAYPVGDGATLDFTNADVCKGNLVKYKAAVDTWKEEYKKYLNSFVWSEGTMQFGVYFGSTPVTADYVSRFTSVVTASDGYMQLRSDYHTYGGMVFENVPGGTAATSQLITAFDNVTSDKTAVTHIFDNIRVQVKVSTDGTVSFPSFSDKYLGDKTLEQNEDISYKTNEVFAFTQSIELKDGNDEFKIRSEDGTIYTKADANYNNGATALNTSSIIGWGPCQSWTKVYGYRYYSRVLEDSEILQNHFADLAKWFKLDVSKFVEKLDSLSDDDKNAYYGKFANVTLASELSDAMTALDAANKGILNDEEYAQNHFESVVSFYELDVSDFYAIRDDYGPKAIRKYYNAFSNLSFVESAQAEAQEVADAAYAVLTAPAVYPELTLDYYNTLYAETDKLITAFDIMALNEHWGMAVNENKGNVGFPKSPMLDKAFAGTYVDYNAEKVTNEGTGVSDYPSKSTWDFTKKATITVGDDEVEIPYYADRFDPRARYDYASADAAKADGKEGRYGALIPAGDELMAVNGGHEFEYHIMRGTYNAGAANGITAYVGATNNGYVFADTEYYTLEDAYNALLGLAEETEDGRWVDKGTKTTYEYWIVGDDTSAAYQRALAKYASDVNLWLAQYTWKGSVTSDPAYPNTGYYMRLSNVFAAYDFAKDPVAGVGYLTSQYPYVSNAGLYFGAGSAIAEGGTKTLEMVTRMVRVPGGSFVILDNNRPGVSGSVINSGGTYFPAANVDKDVTTSAINVKDVDTFRFIVSNDVVINTETQAKGDRMVLEQGDNILYSATGTYTHGTTNMIGHSNAFTRAKIYNLRVYNTELTPAQKKQNNFVDVAKWYRLDVAELENYGDAVKQGVYDAFADYDIESKSRSFMQELFETSLEKSILENLLAFDGYRAKLKEMPGLRSTYSIDLTALETLEAQGKKVIIGAMMTIAEGVATHDSLKVPLTAEGKYDRSRYEEEGKYSYIKNGVAYQEIYNDGLVANLVSKDDKECEFAFTTIYSDGNQTAETFQKGLLYRGFIVVTDKDGTETVIYADMSSDLFDKNDNGAAITIYELSKVVDSDPEKYGATAGNEFIKMVIDAVEAPAAATTAASETTEPASQE